MLRRSGAKLRAFVVASIFIVCCCLAWFSASGTVFAAHQATKTRQDFPPRPGGTPFVIGLPNLNPPTATPGPAPSSATGKHSNTPAPPDAVRVALSNPYVKVLLKGKAYRIPKVAPWPAGKGKLVVVGFYRATTVSGTWLTWGKPSYKATVQRVVGLNIYINMARKLVAAILPHVIPK
jgi:hypothetical protein